MKDRLRMDAAVAGAKALVEKVAPALTRAERRSYRQMVIRILVALLEAYDLQGQREAFRCAPSLN